MISKVKVYIVNLKQDTDRWSNMQHELEKNKISNYERVDAVYGKETSKSGIKSNTSFICNKLCTYSTIGCAMSHKKIWEMILKEDTSEQNMFMVLEDDIVFQENFQIKLKKVLEKVPDDFDVLYLGQFFSNYDNKYNWFTRMIHSFLGHRKHEKINDLIYKPNCPMGTHGYIVSRKGAQKLLHMINSTKIYLHIDFMMSHAKNINVYASKELLVRQSQMNTSHITSNNYPALLFNVLDRIKTEWDVSYGYIFFVPAYEIFGIKVNCINVLLILLFIFVGYTCGDLYSILKNATILFCIYNFIEYQTTHKFLLHEMFKMYILINICILLGCYLR